MHNFCFKYSNFFILYIASENINTFFSGSASSTPNVKSLCVKMF